MIQSDSNLFHGICNTINEDNEREKETIKISTNALEIIEKYILQIKIYW